MTTKTIFDIVMPDLQARQAKLESIIASHSNPEFAAQVCKDLSPLFYFYAYKSWELLKDPQMMTEVEGWFKATDELSVDLIKMASWLLLLIEYRNEDDKHKLIHRFLARHLAKTERHKPKFPKRLLMVIDNAGKKVGALKLVHKDTNSMAETNYGYKETYVNDQNTYLDKKKRIKQKTDTNIETFVYEKGVPRIDFSSVKLIQAELDKLNRKKQDGSLTDLERKQLNMYSHLVRNGRVRFDKPQTDRAAANIRRGFSYFCKKLDEKVENPKFGSDFVKEGFVQGRACIWKDKGILKKKSPTNTQDILRELDELIRTNPRWWFLEHTLLLQADLEDLNLLNTFYEAGRQKDLFISYEKPVALDKIYNVVREKNVEDYSRYLGDKNNLFQYLEAGLRYYLII